jgi:hypothetical protein
LIAGEPGGRESCTIERAGNVACIAERRAAAACQNGLDARLREDLHSVHLLRDLAVLRIDECADDEFLRVRRFNAIHRQRSRFRLSDRHSAERGVDLDSRGHRDVAHVELCGPPLSNRGRGFHERLLASDDEQNRNFSFDRGCVWHGFTPCASRERH